MDSFSLINLVGILFVIIVFILLVSFVIRTARNNSRITSSLKNIEDELRKLREDRLK